MTVQDSPVHLGPYVASRHSTPITILRTLQYAARGAGLQLRIVDDHGLKPAFFEGQEQCGTCYSVDGKLTVEWKGSEEARKRLDKAIRKKYPVV